VPSAARTLDAQCSAVTPAAGALSIDALATLLDTALVIPGTQIRFGLDALIGLVPGIGDAITTAMSLYIVREACAWRIRNYAAIGIWNRPRQSCRQA
jgi:hypothetical protein